MLYFLKLNLGLAINLRLNIQFLQRDPNWIFERVVKEAIFNYILSLSDKRLLKLDFILVLKTEAMLFLKI